ncbi:hypothetical protein [Archangium sp.]|jgi:hypothetical protein|uniref:hypothetical protein n=1 Tax=Archangium sp. TaxID=1872627 RepID=UPI002ED85C18
MRHALAFLTLALLVAGCPKKTGENGDGPVDNPSYRDAGPQTPPPATLSGATPDDAGGTQKAQGGNAAVEACVDRWLKEHKLDSYGHAEGTMYAGGTPLFNEATGESRDRLSYVFERQPDARKACATPSAQ